MNTEQTYANHTRYYPLFHFVLIPILTINLIWQIVRLGQEQTWDRAESVLLAISLIILSLAARLMALKAQDRVIRLEERLRYARLLDDELQRAATELPTGKIISLRFASDDELPNLAKRVVDGELRTAKEIKTAIKQWRGDHLRV